MEDSDDRLPEVKCQAVRRLVQLMATLEAVQEGTYVPGMDGAAGLGAVPLQFMDFRDMPTTQAGCTITNVANAVKRLVTYRLGEWDSNPLVVCTASELAEAIAGKRWIG